MFLKKLTRSKSGKKHVYWALVESYRTPGGSRHRVVSYLGELSRGEADGWAKLARKLTGSRDFAAQGTLFDSEPECEPVPDNVTVQVSGVRVEGCARFGDVWLALVLWRMLGLDEFFARAMPEGQEGVRWDLMAAILAVARLCEPASERHIEQSWYPRTALAELLGVTPEKVHTERLYRTLDGLYPHKEAVEKHLKERLGTLFDIDYDLLLYDVTSTYFEGQAEGNPQAKRGYSRDKRPDCKQICIGLVVTRDGIPLGHEVFDGNRTDVTTIEEIVDCMEERYGRAGRIWVLDRGMVSEQNLEYIRSRGGSYIVGTPRSMLKDYERRLTGSDWDRVHEDVEVKLCAGPEGRECFVLCRSADRAQKERAIHERFSARMEEALTRLQGRLEKTRNRPNRAQVER